MREVWEERSTNNAGVVSAGHGIKAPGSSQRPCPAARLRAGGGGEQGQTKRERKDKEHSFISISADKWTPLSGQKSNFQGQKWGRVQKELWTMSQSPGSVTFYSRNTVRRGKIVQDPRFKKQQETNILANRTTPAHISSPWEAGLTARYERMEPYAWWHISRSFSDASLWNSQAARACCTQPWRSCGSSKIALGGWCDWGSSSVISIWSATHTAAITAASGQRLRSYHAKRSPTDPIQDHFWPLLHILWTSSCMGQSKIPWLFFFFFFYFCLINMFVFLPNSEVWNVHSGLRAKNIKATSWLLLPGLLSPHYSQNTGHFLQKNAKTLVITSLFGHSDHQLTSLFEANLVYFWIYVRRGGQKQNRPSSWF